MANQLADETSPYLLQHADNPVDWFPWGPEALEEARRRDVPVFVSIGYSACHWCHVMAHESFEDEAIAARLNDWFVNVKVDREERPDVDAVYMTATQAMTGRGGWPMSVFTTPDGEPFYAGTYWPAEPRHGMPSFPQVIEAVHEAWEERREETVGQAAQISEAISDRRRREPADEVDPPGVSDRAGRALVEQAWDRERGGFGSAPKFPQPMVLEFLLDRHARTGEDEPLECAVHTLDAIARGGIHDHVGGGFHRYATDGDWLVPHFEKMLYDNALLLPAYAKAAVLADREDLARVARTTADYLLGDMRDDDGGFYASTDADSEGEEGRYFVWSLDGLAEAARAAGADPDRVTAFFGASATGNWEGTNILHEPVPRRRFAEERDLDPEAFADELAAVRDELAERRRQRVPPGLDDKILTSWNALAIRGLVRAGRLLDEPAWIGAAEDTAGFLAGRAVVDGRLHHSWKDGRAAVPALLEDLALLAAALLDLSEATGRLRWYDWAVELAETALERFHDDREGGFFETADDAEELYHRPKSTVDNAQPSGNSVLAEVFARLAGLTGEPGWHERAAEVLRLFQEDAARMPSGFGHLLQVAEFIAAGPREVAIMGPPGGERNRLEQVVWRRPRPGTVVAVAAPGSEAARRIPLLAGREPVDGRPAAYVCRRMVCDAPVTDPDALADALAGV